MLCTHCVRHGNCPTEQYLHPDELCPRFRRKLVKPQVSKWDLRMMEKARLISTWSKDPDHKVGAVIAMNNKTVSEGYNGPPRGIADSDLPRDRETLRTIHAEINAIIFAARPLHGASIYVYPFLPCAACAAAIIQTGITRIIYHEQSSLPKWQESQNEAEIMFREAGLNVFNV